jgi:biotin carboxyl carrier protein
VPDAARRSDRVTTARAADHAGIARLADELLPALIAKLATTHLGELEVREEGWHVRLRRPAVSDVNYGRRSTDRPSRTQPGHEGHGHPRGAPEAARPARLAGVGPGTPDPAAAPTNGTGSPRSAHPARDESQARPDGPARQVATSPAVGVFHPGARAASGTRVRSGDTLGAVDVLGVREDVVSPVDGIVGLTLVEGGTAVEYGQELVRIEVVTATEAR